MRLPHHAALEASVIQAARRQEAVQRAARRGVEVPAQHDRIGRPVREAGQPSDLGQQDGQLGQLDVAAVGVVQQVCVGHAEEGRGIRPPPLGPVGPQQQNQPNVVPVEEGVAGAEELHGIGGEEREAGRFEDDGATVGFISCSLLVLTLVT